jgi:molybdopterin synthase catalytic subunit
VHCRIISQPIDAASLLAEVATPSDGAVLLFWGVVRNENDGREVNGLDYEAYAEMAEAKLREIVAEAAQRWSVGGIAAVHRIGKLNVGEASVGIAVAAPHRAEAYEASRYVIEELKRRVPIWKRENYLDGPSAWLGGAVPAPEVPA